MDGRTMFAGALAVIVLTAACGAQAQPGVRQLADRWIRACNMHDRDLTVERSVPLDFD